MAILRLFTMISILLFSGSVFAQRWVPFASTEDGFRMMAPGEFEIEEIDFETEYGIIVPARIYSHENDIGTFTMTVVDYSDSQRLHEERIEELDGVYISIYGEVDVRGSVAFAAKKIRDRASSIEYDAYHYISRVDGHQLQTTNPDRSRTFAAIYLRNSRLYASEATVKEGSTPPGMFQQSLEFIDDNGEQVRYGSFREVYKVLGAPDGSRF
ncbi:MAG: hypothetical protein P8J68_02590 [Arenicellaceae bacterium]|nr:hypothetical protein [Arenicellaceae bacterium]